MRFSWIYDRLMIAVAFVLVLSFHGGAIAFGADSDGAGASGSTYITNGGVGEGYVPKPHKQRAYPKYSDSYEGEEQPANTAVTPAPEKGSNAVYTNGGGVGEGYVPHKYKKRTYPKYSDSYEKNKKAGKSSVVFTTSEGKKVKAVPGTIAPGWQHSSGDDHSLDFLKGFFHKILPPSKKGVAEKRAAEEVGDSAVGKAEKKPAPAAAVKAAPATVKATTGIDKATRGAAVLNGTIAPGWQPSGNHELKRFFHKINPWGHKKDKGLTSGEVQEESTTLPTGAGTIAVSPTAEDKGVNAAPERPLSRRRSGRSFQTPAAVSEEVKTPEAAPPAVQDEQYLEDEDEFDDIVDGEAAAVADPIEVFNRVIFKFNDKLYFWFFRPVALGYSHVVPEPGRVAVRRFFDNVFMPVRFANNLFQLKFKNAGIELERFAINTTVGVAGFMDPARKYWNLEMHEEDFGQTLGFYGVGPGVYINLPVYGPSNIRDTIGMVADIFLSPTAYILPNDREIVIGINAFDKLNRVSLDIGLYEDIKRDALDPYIFIRNAYQQHRESVIKE